MESAEEVLNMIRERNKNDFNTRINDLKEEVKRMNWEDYTKTPRVFV
jgi:hypothetical protein